MDLQNSEGASGWPTVREWRNMSSRRVSQRSGAQVIAGLISHWWDLDFTANEMKTT